MGYSRIYTLSFSLSRIEAGLTHHEVHPYVSGNEYTSEIPNKFPFLLYLVRAFSNSNSSFEAPTPLEMANPLETSMDIFNYFGWH